MPDGVSTGEAALLLQTSKPTVRGMIDRGVLKATRHPRGTRFSWLIDRNSLDEFLREHGSFDHRRKPSQSRLARAEQEIADLRATLNALVGGKTANTGAGLDDPRGVELERDDLRAQVTDLREALVRSNEVAELQRRADAERATVVEHLLAAAAASERADGHRRDAVIELEEALASAFRPGHLGEID